MGINTPRTALTTKENGSKHRAYCWTIRFKNQTKFFSCCAIIFVKERCCCVERTVETCGEIIWKQLPEHMTQPKTLNSMHGAYFTKKISSTIQFTSDMTGIYENRKLTCKYFLFCAWCLLCLNMYNINEETRRNYYPVSALFFAIFTTENWASCMSPP